MSTISRSLSCGAAVVLAIAPSAGAWAAGVGDCCVANGTPGCDDGACEAAVCDVDLFCCETQWDLICADEAYELCGLLCRSNCCIANGGPGCDVAGCEAVVCGVDPFCCDTEWDLICADEAADLCGGLCDGDCDVTHTIEGEANCGLPVDTVNGGCNSEPPVFTFIGCGEAICATSAQDEMLGLRDTDWYAFTVPPGGGLFRWTVTVDFDAVIGFIDANECSMVGVVDPVALPLAGQSASVLRCFPPGEWWAFVTPNVAGSLPCGAEYEAVLTCFGYCPGEGDCCVANGSPGCESSPCQNAVCDYDPFCCDTEWDEICAEDTFFLCQPLCNPCPADITGPAGVPDGTVDALDYLLLIAQWGTPCGGDCAADITGPFDFIPDGNVNSLDFLLLIAFWGTCPPPM